jgi:hypothetical protein
MGSIFVKYLSREGGSSHRFRQFDRMRRRCCGRAYDRCETETCSQLRPAISRVDVQMRTSSGKRSRTMVRQSTALHPQRTAETLWTDCPARGEFAFANDGAERALGMEAVRSLLGRRPRRPRRRQDGMGRSCHSVGDRALIELVWLATFLKLSCSSCNPLHTRTNIHASSERAAAEGAEKECRRRHSRRHFIPRAAGQWSRGVPKRRPAAFR